MEVTREDCYYINWRKVTSVYYNEEDTILVRFDSGNEVVIRNTNKKDFDLITDMVSYVNKIPSWRELKGELE